MFVTGSEKELGKKPDLVKAIFALLGGLYYLWGVWDLGNRWKITDGVDFFVHEAGHLIFMPFGTAVSVAAGSVLQIVMPAVFVWYFYRQGQSYSAALVMLWVGSSLLYVSWYASDAATSTMVGEDGLIHDWHYILSHLGLLGAASQVSALIWLLGVSTMAAGTFLALKNSFYASRD